MRPPGPFQVPYEAARFELSNGPSGATKGVLGCMLVGFLVVAAPFVAVVVGVFGAVLVNGVVGWIAGVLALLACGVPLLWRLLWVLRTAAWLEHTTLVVRGAFRIRRADLATTPRLFLDSVPETTSVPINGTAMQMATGRRLPRLTAYNVDGRPVRLVLVDGTGKRWLPPPKLHALANAILSAPRPQPQAAWAWQVASGLRAMAADPTGQVR